MAAQRSSSLMDTDDAALRFGSTARRRSHARSPMDQEPAKDGAGENCRERDAGKRERILRAPASPRAEAAPAPSRPLRASPTPALPEKGRIPPRRAARRWRSLLLPLAVPVACTAVIVALAPSPPPGWLDLSRLVLHERDSDVVLVAPVAPQAEPRTTVAAVAPAAEPSPPIAAPTPPTALPPTAPAQPDTDLAGQLQSLQAEIERLRSDAARRELARTEPPPQVERAPPAVVPEVPQISAPPAAAPASIAAASPVPAEVDRPISRPLLELPARATVRVQVRYARGSASSRSRATDIVNALRQQGAVIVGARETSGEPVTRVSYYYASDRAEAARLAVLTSSGAPMRRPLVDSDMLPRPGSFDVAIGSR
jgi:hypothetical protein